MFSKQESERSMEKVKDNDKGTDGKRFIFYHTALSLGMTPKRPRSEQYLVHHQRKEDLGCQ